IAIINAHFDTAAVLIERGADPSVADAAGMTPLYAAIDMKHQEPMINRPLLMRQHSTGDPSLGDGATPLMRAAKVTDVELIKALLEHGANPNLALRNGTT